MHCNTSLGTPLPPISAHPFLHSAPTHLYQPTQHCVPTFPLVQVWPLLVDYFYKDRITISQDNACALLALSRQLLVGPVCQYCTEFVSQHLTTGNCISYLRQAEKYQLHDIQQQAVALAAQGAAGLLG